MQRDSLQTGTVQVFLSVWWGPVFVSFGVTESNLAGKVPWASWDYRTVCPSVRPVQGPRLGHLLASAFQCGFCGPLSKDQLCTAGLWKVENLRAGIFETCWGILLQFNCGNSSSLYFTQCSLQRSEINPWLVLQMFAEGPSRLVL